VRKSAEQRLLDVLPGHVRRLEREIKRRQRRPSGLHRRDAELRESRDLQAWMLDSLRARRERR
jgi:hypothetical protein